MRMYPALVNCTTIDLFNEWPPEALLEVGERYLRDVDLEGNEQVKGIAIFSMTKQMNLIRFSNIYLNLF